MNKYLLIPVVLFLNISFLSCKDSQVEDPSDSNNEFKVLVWNILNGGTEKSLPVNGLTEIIEIIKHSEADIVLIVETYGAAPSIAEGLGYNYKLLSSNLSIYSRFPMNKMLLFDIQIPSFNFGGTEVLVHDQYPIQVFNTWLDYLPHIRMVPVEETEENIIQWELTNGNRYNEITTILKILAPHIENISESPIIIGGDFNSHSHLDWTYETKDLFDHGGAVVEWPISKAMENAGFIDSFREINPKPETNIGATHIVDLNDQGNLLGWSKQYRIDYLYYQGNTVNAIDSESFVAPLGQKFDFHGERFYFPSDHGFVLTTFKIID